MQAVNGVERFTESSAMVDDGGMSKLVIETEKDVPKSSQQRFLESKDQIYFQIYFRLCSGLLVVE